MKRKHIGHLESWDLEMAKRAIVQSATLRLATGDDTWSASLLKQLSQSLWERVDADLQGCVEELFGGNDPPPTPTPPSPASETDETDTEEAGAGEEVANQDELCPVCMQHPSNEKIGIIECCKRCRPSGGVVHGRLCTSNGPGPAGPARPARPTAPTAPALPPPARLLRHKKEIADMDDMDDMEEPNQRPWKSQTRTPRTPRTLKPKPGGYIDEGNGDGVWKKETWVTVTWGCR